jgi:hypothetical protein
MLLVYSSALRAFPCVPWVTASVMAWLLSPKRALVFAESMILQADLEAVEGVLFGASTSSLRRASLRGNMVVPVRNVGSQSLDLRLELLQACE